jgi:hypothetical protein
MIPRIPMELELHRHLEKLLYYQQLKQSRTQRDWTARDKRQRRRMIREQHQKND